MLSGISKAASEHTAYAFLGKVPRITSPFIVSIKLMMFPQVATNAFAMVHDGLTHSTVCE